MCRPEPCFTLSDTWLIPGKHYLKKQVAGTSSSACKNCGFSRISNRSPLWWRENKCPQLRKVRSPHHSLEQHRGHIVHSKSHVSGRGSCRFINAGLEGIDHWYEWSRHFRFASLSEICRFNSEAVHDTIMDYSISELNCSYHRTVIFQRKILELVLSWLKVSTDLW